MSFKQMLRKYRKPSKKGFSLVELLAVVAILAITSGATITVFLMVQDVTRDASKITVNQYNTTSMERLIRNEFQTASNVDVVAEVDIVGAGAVFASEIGEGDEYMKFDEDSHRVTFMRANESGTFETIFTISDIQDASVTITPLNNSVADKSNQPYKLFYQMTTYHYEGDNAYSGGIVLGNTVVNGANDKSMKKCLVDTITLDWKSGSSDNGKVVFFHRDSSKYVSTP